MELSLFIAKMISLFCLACALSSLRDPQFFARVALDIGTGGGLSVLTGTVALILGGGIVYGHNLWTMDWRMAITIFGWLAVIKGLVILIWPRVLAIVASSLAKGRWLMYLSLTFALIFAYFGFMG